jgi:integrase
VRASRMRRSPHNPLRSPPAGRPTTDRRASGPGPVFANLHALRHSFITLLARSGVPPKEAQKLARHGDIRLTMDR